MTRITSTALCLSFLFACKGADDKPADRAPPAAPATAPAPTPAPAAAAAPDAAPPAAPEPSTPEEIEKARKAAMMEGRDLDVIKYCELGKIQPGQGDGQAPLGCALAACRAGQAEKAKAWAKGLPKALRQQAVQICMANKVVL